MTIFIKLRLSKEVLINCFWRAKETLQNILKEYGYRGTWTYIKETEYNYRLCDRRKYKILYHIISSGSKLVEKIIDLYHDLIITGLIDKNFPPTHKCSKQFDKISGKLLARDKFGTKMKGHNKNNDITD